MHIDDSMTNMPTMVNSRTPALSEVQIMIIPSQTPILPLGISKWRRAVCDLCHFLSVLACSHSGQSSARISPRSGLFAVTLCVARGRNEPRPFTR
jgi:hypothetical protein